MAHGLQDLDDLGDNRRLATGCHDLFLLPVRGHARAKRRQVAPLGGFCTVAGVGHKSMDVVEDCRIQ